MVNIYLAMVSGNFPALSWALRSTRGVLDDDLSHLHLTPLQAEEEGSLPVLRGRVPGVLREQLHTSLSVPPLHSAPGHVVPIIISDGEVQLKSNKYVLL